MRSRSLVLLLTLALAACSSAATPAASSTLPGPPTLTATASASPSPVVGVLDERFGFLGYDRVARVRSETSDAVISSFTSKGRSFTFLSHVVSPDGRFVAYWDPVDNGAVLHVLPATGGSPRAVLTGRPEMSGSAFTWSSDGTGLVAALDNNCFEICGIQGGHTVAELWTVDLASGATEQIASGSIWLPVTWDRGAKLVGAGVTGPGGYLVGYDVIDLRRQPYAVRSTPFRPTVFGRLKASSDARFVLIRSDDQTGRSSLAWWPLAEPEKRSAVTFDGATADWRPGTSEIWWVGGLTPPGCRVPLCTGTDLAAFDVVTGARRPVIRGSFGGTLVGFRVDGSAAITGASGSTSTLIIVDVRSGSSASIPLTGQVGEPVRLR